MAQYRGDPTMRLAACMLWFALALLGVQEPAAATTPDAQAIARSEELNKQATEALFYLG